MSSKVVAHSGDPVDAIRNAENTADMQGVAPLISKDAFDLITVAGLSAPTFGAPPYNLETLAKHPILNAGCLHIWGTAPSPSGAIQFYVVLFDASGTPMSVQPATPASLAPSPGQDGTGDYHSAGLLDMWVASAAQVGLWVTAVSGGPWKVFLRPY